MTEYVRDVDLEVLIDLYTNQKLTIKECASKLNSYPKRLQRMLQVEGVAFRKKACYLSGPDNPKYTGYEEIQGAYIAGKKVAAKRLGIEWNLTGCDMWDQFIKQDRKCAYTGMELTFSKTNNEHRLGVGTASLDRIDSAFGYIIGNVQWLHKRVNVMKGNMDESEFLALCNIIARNNPSDVIPEKLSRIHSHTRRKH